MNKTPQNKPLQIALIGSPNAGKTTLFNRLTGTNQTTGNWPGVTVEKKVGRFKIHKRPAILTDLPGVYSLENSARSGLDEKVAREFLQSQAVDILINVVDANCLERQLFLTAQLLHMGLPVVVALNRTDQLTANHLKIDVQKLSEKLGCPVFPMSAYTNSGVADFKQKLPGLVVFPRSTRQQRHLSNQSVTDEQDHHEHEHEHEQEALDPHIWLSIANARLMVSAIAAQLTRLQPDRATEIAAITQQLQADYQRLDQQMTDWLAPVRQQPYLLLHDGYQYFEQAYGLQHLGVVQVSDELKPSIKQVLALRKIIQSTGARCVFKEPQFSDRQLQYIIQGLAVEVGELDPLGQGQLDYLQLMRQMAQAVVQCLQPSPK